MDALIGSNRKVFRYKLESVLSADSPSQLQPEHELHARVVVPSPNSLVVLPDAETVVAIQMTETHQMTSYRLVAENIRDRSRSGWLRSWAYFSFRPTALSHNERLNALLVGDSKGNLYQFDMNPGRSWLRAQKLHGRVGLGRVTSIVHVGHLAIVAGNQGHLRVADMRRRVLLRQVVVTEIDWVCALEACLVRKSEQLVSVVGTSFEPLRSWLFVYDVAGLAKSCEMKPGRVCN